MPQRGALVMLLVFAVANMFSDRPCAGAERLPQTAVLTDTTMPSVVYPPGMEPLPPVQGAASVEHVPLVQPVQTTTWQSVYARPQQAARVAAPLLHAPVREPDWLPVVYHEPEIATWSYYQQLADARIESLPSTYVASGPDLIEPLPSPASPPSTALELPASEPEEDGAIWGLSEANEVTMEDLGLLDGGAVAEVESDFDDDYSIYYDELKRWKGRLEAGVNGTEGNSQNFQTRLGLKAARTTDEETFKFDGLYARSENASQVTENKFIVDLKNDWLLPQREWSYFVAFLTEYDEFRAFGVRMTLTTGVTRILVDDELRMLKLHIGGGTTRETGTPQTEFVPEAKLGYELSWKITGRQKFTSDTTTFIDVTDIGDLRVNTRAGWQVLIDPEHNLNLELGLLNRYDSTPNGKKFNDLDYSMLLFWEF